MGRDPAPVTDPDKPDTPDPHGAAPPLERRVPPGHGGIRLDVFLGQQPEFESRTTAKAWIRAARVTVDGRPGKPGQVLETGQRVVFEGRVELEHAGDVAEPVRVPRILFEDATILVIDKPAGLVCHPARHQRKGQASVSGWAEEHAPGLPVVAGEDRPGIVHRLDKETSGVMVLAKTEDAFHFLKGEFKARRVEKEYRAVTFGEARFESDFIDRNIANHPHKGDRMAVVRDGGREASTFYEVVERFRGFTHFSCRPKTGRTHQIRVHMTSIGHGLVGDRFYRSRNHASAVLPDGAPDPERHCLHALRLSFEHPLSRARVGFEAQVAEDMDDLLNWLRDHRSI